MWPPLPINVSMDQGGASARTNLGVGHELVEAFGDEIDGGLRIDRPMRDEQCASTCVKESAGKASGIGSNDMSILA